MKTLIVNGIPKNCADPVSKPLLAALNQRGWAVDTINMADSNIAPCMGDFKCWLNTPGICAISDDNRQLARSIAQSDLVVYLTPVTFGGYSYELKKGLDHIIPNLLPFFININGETHHPKRYKHEESILFIGTLPEPDMITEQVFDFLTYRNALNMRPPAFASGIIYEKQAADEINRKIESWLTAIEAGQKPIKCMPPKIIVQQPDANSIPKNALLLVGSPRGLKSTSAALGGYLMEQLTAKGIQTETIAVYPALNNEERLKTLLKTIDQHDLIVLAFPLYIDSLPSRTIRLLEALAEHRKAHPRLQTFVSLVNCGFPEEHQNNAALGICANFARLAGMAWGGGLSLGGGGAINAMPLKELGGRAFNIIRSLDLAAEALARGQSIPEKSVALMAKTVIPAFLYRIIGGVGWKLQAKPLGTQNRLWEKPYAS